MENDSNRLRSVIFWCVIATSFCLFMTIWTQNDFDTDRSTTNLYFWGCLFIITLTCTVLVIWKFVREREIERNETSAIHQDPDPESTVLKNNKSEETNLPYGLQPSKNIEIISEYGALLEISKSTYSKESDLPYPKEVIEKALIEELGKPHDPEFINALEVGYISLAVFLDQDDFGKVEKMKDALDGIVTRKESNSEMNDQDLLKLANQLVEADHAQSSLIDEKIRHDQLERMKKLETMKNYRELVDSKSK